MKKINAFFFEIQKIIFYFTKSHTNLPDEAIVSIVTNIAYNYILSFACTEQDYNYLKKYNVEVMVPYWLKHQKNIENVCTSIIFDIFCLIDGVSSENDFHTIHIDVELPENQEYHAAWCDYLREKGNFYEKSSDKYIV